MPTPLGVGETRHKVDPTVRERTLMRPRGAAEWRLLECVRLSVQDDVIGHVHECMIAKREHECVCTRGSGM
jgi:hypothetical protein